MARPSHGATTCGLIVLAAMAPRGLQAQSCSTTDCTSACLVFDGSWNTCNYDYANKGFDSLTSCLCRWAGLSKTVKALAQCTSCQQDGLGSNSLRRYEVWTVICNTFETEGETNALNIGSSASSKVLDLYTASYLPIIESAYCGVVVTSASLTTSDASSFVVTTTDDGSGGFNTPTSSTSVVSSSRTSPPSPTTTPSDTNDAKAKPTHILGLPLILVALLGFAMR